MKPRFFSKRIFSLLAGLLAFKTKENTAALLLAIEMLEWLLFSQSSESPRKRSLFVIPCCMLVLVIPLSFLSAQTTLSDLPQELLEKSVETPEFTHSQYFLTQMRVIITYIRLLCMTVHQSIDYYYPLYESIFELRVILSMCGLAVLLGTGFRLYRKFPLISTGIF